MYTAYNTRLYAVDIMEEIVDLVLVTDIGNGIHYPLYASFRVHHLQHAVICR